MAEVKWIKIYTGMVSNKKIKRIRKMPEGNNIILIWVFLLAQAGESNKNGALYLTDTIPFKSEDLAIEFDFERSTIEFALITLEKFEMIEVFEEVIYIRNWNEYQNIDGLDRIREQTRKRVAEHRVKNRGIDAPHNDVVCESVTKDICNVTCNVTVTQCNDTEVEVEEEVDIEKESITTATTENYMEFFNNNFHLISPFEYETLRSYEKDGVTPDVITLALKEAVEKNARDMKYVKTILNRWLQNRILTVDAVKADKAEFERKKVDKTTKESKYPQKKQSTFNNYDQRTYDFEKLENQLLTKDKGEEGNEPFDIKKELESFRK